MSRQKKRTLRKYNKSRKKNNTLRKTRKKRVRKTHKKRKHKRMKGGSNVGLISGVDKRSSTQKATQGASGVIQSLRRGIKLPTPDKVGEQQGDISKQQYQLFDEPTPLPEPISPPAPQLPAAQLPATQPQAVTQPTQQQVVAPSSNQSKNKEVLKHVASGLGGAVIYSNPAAVAGTALGALGAYGTYKAGQGAYRVIGSAKDKLKSKALIKNIKQCLEKLVFYAVIDRAGEKAILERLRENSGYFGEDGKGPKITFKGEERREQKAMKRKQGETNEIYKNSGNFLNVGETPVVQVPSQEVPGVTTAVNTAPAEVSTAVATPEEYLLGLSQLQTSPSEEAQEGAFDYLKQYPPQPAGAGFKAALDVN